MRKNNPGSNPVVRRKRERRAAKRARNLGRKPRRFRLPGDRNRARRVWGPPIFEYVRYGVPLLLRWARATELPRFETRRKPYPSVRYGRWEVRLTGRLPRVRPFVRDWPDERHPCTIFRGWSYGLVDVRRYE